MASINIFNTFNTHEIYFHILYVLFNNVMFCLKYLNMYSQQKTLKQKYKNKQLLTICC